MEEKKTVKRMVTKPVEEKLEKFVPPVAEVVEEVEPVVEKVEVIAPVVMPESKPTQIKWGLFYVGVLLLVLVVGFSGGMWWAYRTGVGLVSPTPTPTVAINPATAGPSPTPISIAIDKSVIVVDVLNASGVTGKAGTVATQLKALGYKKGATGNAAKQTGSTVSFSEDIATLSAVILPEIQGIVSGVVVSDAPISGSTKIRLVLGSE